MGGPGEDYLKAGGGADLVRGGPATDDMSGQGGRDILHAGSGADVLGSNDGSPDKVNCGAGRDDLDRDPRIDRVRECEVLH